jgi:hypothetical protein
MAVTPSLDDLRYLDMGEDELLLVIGQSLLSDTLSERPADNRDVRQSARRWFDQQTLKLKALICDNPGICSQLSRDKNDRNVLFGILFDALAGTLWGVPVGALTAQILIFGIAKLCPELGRHDNGSNNF